MDKLGNIFAVILLSWAVIILVMLLLIYTRR